MAAVINNYGEDARGHCSITLFSKERIVTFVDKNFTTKSKSILKSKTFNESTNLLFHTREKIPLENDNINNLHKPWLINSDSKSLIEQQWLGDIPVDISNIDANDLRRLCGKEWVNDDIITSFLQGIAAAVSDRTALSFQTLPENCQFLEKKC